jgi:hypothetical protein
VLQDPQQLVRNDLKQLILLALPVLVPALMGNAKPGSEGQINILHEVPSRKRRHCNIQEPRWSLDAARVHLGLHWVTRSIPSLTARAALQTSYTGGPSMK